MEGNAMHGNGSWIEAGALDRRTVDEALDRLAGDDVVERIWARDHTVWKPDPEEIANRLGWLDAPERASGWRGEVEGFAAGVRAEGVERAVLVGMGGSSLAPEVFARVFGPAASGLPLEVLDTTDPVAVDAALGRYDPARTLVVVSSKSGTTVETRSLFRAHWRRAVAALGAAEAGDRFAAVTDPGSPLADLARRLGFRATFHADPEVGGRYSALTRFGLAPAALVGVDLERLLARARAAAEACRETDPRGNPGARLGAALGALATAGRDKLTLVAADPIEPLGSWIEQLIAESTGKDGRGILPVTGEPVAAPEAYGDDRLFVALGLAGEAGPGPGLEALARAGHPVVRLELADRWDLGAQFVIWEFATAVAGHLIGIQPFDQPNVESAKKRAKERVEAYRESGSLDEPDPTFADGGLRGWTPFPAADLAGAADGLVERARPGGYVAVQAFLPPGPALDGALQALRLALRDRTGLATTWAYGPRYLHSTGQLHKGDAGDGLFLMLTADPPVEVPIPDAPDSDASSIGFGVLERAQALGDRRALEDAGRDVVRLHATGDPVAAVERVREALAG